ncbi:MAG: hypothetical protein M1839_008186 [Geoglossum umbratile]|nr:MAG: hypothetical protein M1839_008186 [Geoglossum umbratile]
MALESPLIPSPSGLLAAFIPFADKNNSPRSPRFSMMSHSHESTDRLAPNHFFAASPLHDEVGNPSPINSNGTSSTDMDDSVQDGFENEAERQQESPKHPESISGGSVKSDLTVRSPHNATGPSYSEFPGESAQARIKALDTSIPTRARSDSDDAPLSVIHAPTGFHEASRWEGARSTTPTRLSQIVGSANNTPTMAETPQKISGESPVSPPTLSTSMGPSRNSLENATPRAQTRQEVEALQLDRDFRPRLSRNLEASPDIPEAYHVENEDMLDGDDALMKSKDEATGKSYDSADEITVLNTALGECWTLCNTLAGLSSIHRERIFNYPGTRSVQEQAFKCCWKLCVKLYENREEDLDIMVRPTLDLCRDFCQSLFEIRQRDDEVADSVLRVSFELNNHLYNTHDRNLPEAFRERTLDFYITLCHRLMKQRGKLVAETDTLLQACWSLAEMLFSLRQNRREGKEPDEELLGSAVQACWELCDLFREGWTQVRPDRGTPRASQTKFNVQVRQNNLPIVPEKQSEPETPTTIFDDVAISPDEAPVPNILVLGTESNRLNPRWSSNSSTLSGYSQSSRTSSTATPQNLPEDIEDINMTRLKVLIVKAAMNSGYQRSQGQTLNTFVKSLPSGSFGTTPWQASLLENYRKMVLTDPALRAPANLPPRRATASEVGRAVIWMMRTGAYPFLRDLYRLVFGFHIEEAELRKNVAIQT